MKAILILLKMVFKKICIADKQAELKAMRSFYQGRRNSWVPIEKYEAQIPIKKGSASPSIKNNKFPLMLAWPSTVHKVKGLHLQQGVSDFDLQKQKIIPARVNIYCPQ